MSIILNAISEELENKIINYRRDFHEFAESGWTEFRTAAKVAEILDDLGFNLKLGREVIAQEARMGLPDQAVLKEHYQRAKAQGANQKYLEKFKDGFTGVVATIENGEGPTLGFRFDMDAVEMTESQSDKHRPVAEGFVSKNEKAAHACGHDGHTAIGLGLAEVLVNNQDKISGKIKLIFQPAEEGVRGAKSIVEKGILDDLDYLYGLHLGLNLDSGEVYPGAEGFLATSKFDAIFQGEPAHAGGSPEAGKNSLLAASSAVNNLYAISRHSGGTTRINVGRLEAGTGRNVIPDRAKLIIETRGSTSELNQYMYDQAVRVLKGSADIYQQELEIKAMGGAKSVDSDKGLMDKVYQIAKNSEGIKYVHQGAVEMGGSEDFTYMMEKVQENGGQATFIILGSEIVSAHHTAEFDFNEADLIRGVNLLARLALN
ncbi:MAG: amidohydrolase [Halarsenatibacteraceae bacterium]